MPFILGDLQYFLSSGTLQLNLYTQHFSVAITIDNFRHPLLSCATPYKLLALHLCLNSSEENAFNKTMVNLLT